MTIEEFRRYSDDEEMIERVEEYLKQVDEGGSCEGKYELAVLLESIHNKNLDEEVFELYKDVAESSLSGNCRCKGKDHVAGEAEESAEMVRDGDYHQG